MDAEASSALLVASLRVRQHPVPPSRCLVAGTWAPLAGDLVSGLLEDKPDLVGYPELLAAWARAEARCILFGEYLIDRFTDGDEKSDEGPALRRAVREVGA